MWPRETCKPFPQESRRGGTAGDVRGLTASGLPGAGSAAQQPANHVWAWDFVFDSTTEGSPLKWLSIEDEFTRECLVLTVDRSITSEDVIDTLADLFAIYGVPQFIRSDNGPEFVGKPLRNWLERIGVGTLYMEPGSPWENGYAESFHSRVRDEFQVTEEFESLSAARGLTRRWREDYNQVRPHSSLGYVGGGCKRLLCIRKVISSGSGYDWTNNPIPYIRILKRAGSLIYSDTWMIAAPVKRNDLSTV